MLENNTQPEPSSQSNAQQTSQESSTSQSAVEASGRTYIVSDITQVKAAIIEKLETKGSPQQDKG